MALSTLPEAFLSIVIARLVRAINCLPHAEKMDHPDKPGDDGGRGDWAENDILTKTAMHLAHETLDVCAMVLTRKSSHLAGVSTLT